MTKRILFLGLLVLAFSLNACDDSASSSSENDAVGSFPAKGDPDFYCNVTEGSDNGTYWIEMKVNIPKYKGHLERLTYDDKGNGTQYIEDAYFRISMGNMVEMCLDFKQFIREEKQERNITESYCKNGVSYFVTEFKNVSMSNLVSRGSGFHEQCKDYKRDWESGEYDDYQ